MKIIRRNTHVIAALATEAIAKEIQGQIAPKPKKEKVEKVRAEKSRDMYPGEELSYKLNQLIEDSENAKAEGTSESDDQKARDRKIQKIGREARALMPDADCDAMFHRAKSAQRDLDSDSASTHWSAAFITGWVQKKVLKSGDNVPKVYRLVVDIPGSPDGSREAEHHEQSYETSLAAEWAAVRWMTVKTDIGHLVVCRIETLDRETMGIPGQKPVAIESLSYVLTYERARLLMSNVDRRLKRPPVIWEKKTKGGPFGVKVKNYVATFSGG